jgi:hypothetical protein
MRVFRSTLMLIECTAFVLGIGFLGCCPPYDLDGSWTASGSCVDDPATPGEETAAVDVHYACPEFASTSPDWMDCRGIGTANGIAASCSDNGSQSVMCDLIISSETLISGVCIVGQEVCTVVYER